MLRNTLSYKFSTFMGFAVFAGIILFFTIQEFADANISRYILLYLILSILFSDIILAILVIIDFVRRKTKKPKTDKTNSVKLIFEILSITFYLLISGFLTWIAASIYFYKP